MIELPLRLPWRFEGVCKRLTLQKTEDGQNPCPQEKNPPRKTKIKLSFCRSLKLKMTAIVAGTVLLTSGVLVLFLTHQFSRLALLTVHHEGILLSDAVTAAISPSLLTEDIASIKKYTDTLVKNREVNDIEINVMKLMAPDTSEIIISNNSGNIEQTDEEEHTALLAALTTNKPHIDIEDNPLDVDPDDDISTYEDPSHPDHYISPGYRVMSITTPLKVQGQDWGSVNIEISLKYLDQKLDEIYLYLGIALSSAIILLAAGLIHLLNWNFFDPLYRLADVMSRFGLGQAPKPGDFKNRHDEIGVLTHEFLDMMNRLNRTEAQNREYRDHLEVLVDERTRELMQTQEATILCMASLAETRDPETGAHIKRTQNYIKVLAEQLRHHPKFQNGLDDETIDLIYKSAPLHDIGKVGIKDDILLKPGKLSREEFETMKLHTVYGRDALRAAEETLGSNSFLRFAQEIAYTHQEKWDGSGYPQGLKGEEIPLSSRLMAIADVYDALISKRVYKPAFSHEKAMEIIREGRGSHFDPDVVDAFILLEADIKSIAKRYEDSKIPTSS